jgi:glycosyl transferase family 87
MVMSMLPLEPTAWLMLAGSVAALLAAVWLTFGALGWHGTSRLGAASAVSAVAFWTEPVQRTLHVGEVDLLLMLLVIWDLTSRGRRWQGAGLGMAAGIKLVALIFIPYLLLTGRYRQAGAATGLAAAIFGAWPSMWPGGGPAVPWGLIWYAPATPGGAGQVHPEYHWAGLQLLAGNLYLFAGLVVLAAAGVGFHGSFGINKSGMTAGGGAMTPGSAGGWCWLPRSR